MERWRPRRPRQIREAHLCRAFSEYAHRTTRPCLRFAFGSWPTGTSALHHAIRSPRKLDDPETLRRVEIHAQRRRPCSEFTRDAAVARRTIDPAKIHAPPRTRLLRDHSRELKGARLHGALASPPATANSRSASLPCILRIRSPHHATMFALRVWFMADGDVSAPPRNPITPQTRRSRNAPACGNSRAAAATMQ